MAVSDILSTKAKVYYAAFGEALPDETSVDFDGAWGGNWTALGETLTPVVWNASISEFPVDVQSTPLPVKTFVDAESHTFTFTLAELTGANLALVMHGTNTDTAAGSSQKGYSKIQIGGKRTVTLYTVGFEGYREDSAGTLQPVRIFSFNSAITVAGSVPMDKRSVMGIPLMVTSYADLTSHSTEGQQALEIHVVTAPATA